MPSDASLLNPNVKILIQNKPLPPEIEADLVSVLVSEDLEAPGMFELQLVTWDLLKQEMTWVDDKLFDVGNEVEIQMGYEQELKTLMVGEITGLEPEYTQDAAPILVVRGHDLRHRLLRGSHTKSFLKIKDSEIVSQIARTRGLTAKVTDSKVKLEYILQHNQTDWDFLKERAKRIGYEVAVEQKTLYFRPHNNAKAKVLTLTYGEDLQEFFPRLSTMNQVQQLEIKGWIPKDKKEVLGKAVVGKEGGTMAGSTSGTKATKKAFGESSYTIVNQPVSSKEEADSMALGQFQDMAIAYISGEGSCQGNPNLRAGKVIEIVGLGKRFSGFYYIISAEHTYSKNQGYKTSFTVRRNAT
ncbi:phage late control D family protein [Nostoc sp. UCD121]|uniref:phage late control D family protein n=1 Tax=unclassified Nostoc TaxID=2593658 RepID=UPI001623502D|nr:MULTISPECIES: contractile injection system protein, VgrG/Pvc8 family [unclassified Nostoc]MBC1221001.1 phage late control D family protein [Nostoc sp. UCD120]MBC1277597.1 phage late control D family protein [Nostoc sp. UCD121]MBC1296079.1 phage late control D family protein [Nostoc sp. UCD122]